jgi:hypothetical protein
VEAETMSGMGNGERDNAMSQMATGWGETESVTAEAERLTRETRHNAYGHPADDFGKVTGMAQALWGRGPETPIEHAMYQILVKLSREAHEHKRDNLVDICGYARTIEMIVERGNVSKP